MSPRRSSRARMSQPSPLVPTQTNSSNSSVSSDRTQRATRSHNKLGSPQRTMPRSQSQDDTEELSKPPPRRTRSGHNEIKEPTPSVDLNGDLDDEDVHEEDEITRCVCGSSDYPGLCVPLVDTLKKVGYLPPADQTYEQLGDVFLCCDTCHVWQHAGCVGILGKINEPESYYCEECRRDLHRIFTSTEGQRYSRYLPVMDEPPYRKSPKPSTRNGKTKERPRSNTDSLYQKRRITMNSRNEDEELARAIEESKRDKAPTPTALAARNGKRSRDDDDEYVYAGNHSSVTLVDSDGPIQSSAQVSKANRKLHRRKSVTVKRQRTNSSSPPQETKVEPSDEESVEPQADATPKKSARATVTRHYQAKEAKEQKELERQAAANARKARSERRRGEDSDHEDQANENIPSTAASSPPPESTPAATRIINRKKPTPARRGRVGRNQNVRDRDSPGPYPPEDSSNLLATNPHNTRARSRSRSVARDDESRDRRGGIGTPNGIEHDSKASNGGTRGGIFDDGGLLAKPSKAKNFNEKKTSMNEMKKRVAAILEFVHRAQTERTGKEGGSSVGMSRSTSEAGGQSNGPMTGTTEASSATAFTVTVEGDSKTQIMTEGKSTSRETFEQLNAAEMLVSLKTRLVAFEGSFGRWGDGR